MDVQQSNSNAVRFDSPVLKLFQQMVFELGAIICDGNVDGMIFGISFQADMTGVCNDFHGIIDGIVNQWLNGHLRKFCIQDGFFDFLLIVQSLFIEPDPLNSDVVLYNL